MSTVISQALVEPHDIRMIGVDRVLARGNTGTTRYSIVDFIDYGRSLLIDGLIQSTEFDEGLYHEMLFAPACAFHGAVEKAVVIGGANGGVINRLQYLPTLKSIYHIDIDETLYQICKYILPHLHDTAEEHVEYRLSFAHPVEWLKSPPHEFKQWADFILLDLPDAAENSYATEMFSHDLFAAAAELLSRDGVLATHIGCSHPHPSHVKLRTKAISALRSVFENVQIYHQYIPSLGMPWGFAIASDRDLSAFSSHDIGARILALPPQMRSHYSADMHRKITDALPVAQDAIINSRN